MRLLARRGSRTQKQRTFGTRFETLESRCLLAGKPPAQIMIQEMASTLHPGTTELFIFGTKKNDGISMNADVYMIPGSTGTVGTPTDNALVKGSGKDHLRFTIEQGTDTSSTANIFAQAIGTTGKGKVAHTANVTVKTKGTVTLVP